MVKSNTVNTKQNNEMKINYKPIGKKPISVNIVDKELMEKINEILVNNAYNGKIEF